jgi:hypothetical protein
MVKMRINSLSEEINGMDMRLFSYSFSELALDSAILELLMGFQPGDVPDPFPDMIATALKEGPGLFEVKAGYRIFSPVHFRKDTLETEVGGHLFSTGKTVFNQIRKSSETAFFMATAGHKITDRCRQLNGSGDNMYGYVLDVLGSVVVEKAAEKIMDELEAAVLSKGWHISESYSPGFCDWDVAEQQKLFALFPPGFCGISLSASSVMTPVKSVSGIIGIGPGLERNGSQCRLCTDMTCMYGRFRRGK